MPFFFTNFSFKRNFLFGSLSCYTFCWIFNQCALPMTCSRELSCFANHDFGAPCRETNKSMQMTRSPAEENVPSDSILPFDKNINMFEPKQEKNQFNLHPRPCFFQRDFCAIFKKKYIFHEIFSWILLCSQQLYFKSIFVNLKSAVISDLHESKSFQNSSRAADYYKWNILT